MFDVDGTLTDAPRARVAGRTLSAPVQACLEANHLVGVATASGRRWQDACTADGRSTNREAWATDDLCEAMAAVGFATFCSTGGGDRAQIGGVSLRDLKANKRRDLQVLREAGRHGLAKAWALEQVWETSFPLMSKSQIVLFDNEPSWVRDALLTGVSAYCVNPSGRDVCGARGEAPYSGFDLEGVRATLAARRLVT